MKNYTLKLLLRLALLTGVITLTVLAFLDDRILINRFILVIILAVVLGELFWFLNYTNRQLRLFVESLSNEDYTVRFPEKGNRSIRMLNKSFQEVILHFKSQRGHEESQHQYMETAFDRLNAGIMSFTTDHKIAFMNQKACDLLGTGRIHSLSALKRIHPALVSQLMSDDNREHMLMEVRVHRLPVTLSLRSTRIRMENQEFMLLAFHDIREALDHREIESWTRLIRILTHEIMNSVTPIASLSESMYKQLCKSTTPGTVSAGQLEDLTFSLQTINRRSEGLLSFVEDYRQFTRIGKPSPGSIPLKAFMDHLTDLFREDLHKRGISLSVNIPENAMLYADQVQAEQAVINILRNALDALENTSQGEIRIDYSSDARFDCISISDNGPGIPPEELREVFVPFFTTKKTGSGIGLSLTRQILHGHGGTIDLTSVVNEGTRCTLFFPSEH